jgi:hypothetical protein
MKFLSFLKQQRIKTLLIAVIGASIILQGCSVIGIRTTEEAPYTIISKFENIEVRRYKKVMAVETFVQQEAFKDASNIAFKRLFEYITGENIPANNIAMTAPVMAYPSNSGSGTGKKISMTSPVIAQPGKSIQKGWTLRFVLPEKFTLKTSPLPLNPLVTLVELPAKTIAAINYTGLWDDEKFQEQRYLLNQWLEKNSYISVSTPAYAGYDPPWALPFLRRNEVMIDVQL